MSDDAITKGFLLAGLMNILAVPLFSLGLTNRYLSELSPQVFSQFGLGMIMVWGAAYVAVAWRFREVRWLVAVFAIEKLIYTVSWFVWLAAHAGQLGAIYGRSPLTGVFYTIYGPNDLLFGLFFAYVFIRTGRAAPPGSCPKP